MRADIRAYILTFIQTYSFLNCCYKIYCILNKIDINANKSNNIDNNYNKHKNMEVLHIIYTLQPYRFTTLECENKSYLCKLMHNITLI